MEQALYAEDPKFASQMQGSAARARLRRSISIGAVGVLAGLGLVIFGVVREAVWLGAIGFALMVGGVAYAISPAKSPKAKLGAVASDGSVREHTQGKAGKPRQGTKASKATKQTLMRRLEERWDRRRHDQQ
jgi:hypothetical protein